MHIVDAFLGFGTGSRRPRPSNTLFKQCSELVLWILAQLMLLWDGIQFVMIGWCND